MLLYVIYDVNCRVNKAFINGNNSYLLHNKDRENLWNTGKTQGKHREFDLGKNVANLKNFGQL